MKIVNPDTRFSRVLCDEDFGVSIYVGVVHSVDDGVTWNVVPLAAIRTETTALDQFAALVADGLLTVRECAEFLHLSRSKVYELMNAGILCYAKLGRSRRIPGRAVIELAARELKGGIHPHPEML